MSINSDTASRPTEAPALPRERGTAQDRNLDPFRQGAAQATAGFDQAQTKIEAGQAEAREHAETVLVSGQQNVAAFTKSAEIWVAGLHDLSRQCAHVAQSSIDDAREQFRAFTAAKTMRDAVALQTNMIRTNAEKAVSETGRFAQACIRLTEATLAPIVARMGTAADGTAADKPGTDNPRHH